MKDIVITKKRQKTELWSLLICFVIGFALNVYAIITRDGEWSELFWSLGFVALTTVILYVVWTILRIAVHLVSLCIKRKK